MNIPVEFDDIRPYSPEETPKIKLLMICAIWLLLVRTMWISKKSFFML